MPIDPPNLDYYGATTERSRSPYFPSPWKAWAQILALAVLFATVGMALVSLLFLLLRSAFAVGLGP